MLFRSPSIRKQIRELERQISNLTTALTGAMETAAASYIIQQINSIDENKRKLESDLRKAEIEKRNEETAEETKTRILNDIEWLLQNMDNLEYSVKNEVIRKTVKTCVFDGDVLRIIF